MVEAVANARGVDIYLSSGIKKLSQRQQSYIAVHEQDRLDTIAENLILRLGEIEVHSEGYERLVMASERDLKNRYVEAGIAADRINFPRVYFVPDEYKMELGARSEMTCATFKEIGNVCIVYISDQYDLNMAATIHHELHHAVGRKSFAIVGKMRGGEMVIKTRRVQTGHKLVGNLFEEGVVDYFSIKFAMESDDPVIAAARENDYEPLGGSTKYQKAVEVVEKLIDRASDTLGEGGALEMKRLMLAARVDPVAKSQLVRLINYLYHDDNRVAKYLYMARLSVNDGDKMLGWMTHLASGRGR